MALINASDSAHDFNVKLSLFMCSHSSCLLRLAPTMFYILMELLMCVVWMKVM